MPTIGSRSPLDGIGRVATGPSAPCAAGANHGNTPESAAPPAAARARRRARSSGLVGIGFLTFRVADLLEMKRRMPRVGLQELIVLVRELANLGRQRLVQRPEAGRGVVIQIFLA